MIGFRRDPFSELATEFARVQNDFHRLFNARPASVSGPLLNVWSDEHNVYVQADLPGVEADKIDISISEGNELTIQAERNLPEAPNAVWMRQERLSGKFVRTVTLPVLVDPDKVEATYEHGVLKLTLPKHEAAKPRKITVK